MRRRTARSPTVPPALRRRILARALDATLARLARGAGLLDVAIGNTLLRLDRGDRLIELGFSQLKDYLREAAGLPPSTYYRFVSLARYLLDRPLLGRAVRKGLVSPRKALIVAKLALGDDEQRWTQAAAGLTEKKLALAVSAAGSGTALDSFETRSTTVPMNAPEQEILEHAIRLARWVIGMASPRWACLDAIAMECISGLADFAPEDGAPAPDASGDPGPEAARAENRDDRAAPGSSRGAGDGAGSAAETDAANRLAAAWYHELTRRGRALGRLLEILEAAEAASGAGGDADHELEALSGPEQARALNERVLGFVAARRGFDEPLGRLLLLADELRLWTLVGYPDRATWARERLGMAPRTVRERIWLERRMRELPPLRAALCDGRLSWSKLRTVARDATPDDVAERIARAAATTANQVEREHDAEEEERHRRRGRRRIWGPADVMDTFDRAVRTIRAWFRAAGRAVSVGGAVAAMAYHFLAVWAEFVRRKRRALTRLRRRILLRKGGLCANPVCSRAATHVHHIVYRSDQGSDLETNLIALCTRCHLAGEHRKNLKIRGRAGERVTFQLGLGGGRPLWEYVTEGDADDYRTVGASSPSARAG